MTGWKTENNNSSTAGSELWRNAGPSAFQLQMSMLKSDKIRYAYLVVNCVGLRTFWTPLVCLLVSFFHYFIPWNTEGNLSMTDQLPIHWHFCHTL